MASTVEYRDFILGQLDLLIGLSSRKMMGEYLLYYQGVYFGGIFDDRFLVKKTKTNEKYHLRDALPYEGAKKMLFVSEVENKDILKALVEDTYQGLLLEK